MCLACPSFLAPPLLFLLALEIVIKARPKELELDFVIAYCVAAVICLVGDCGHVFNIRLAEERAPAGETIVGLTRFDAELFLQVCLGPF